MSEPIPTGVGASFAKVPPGGTTGSFTLGTTDTYANNAINGNSVIITFQPVDPANPGTVTLNDTSSYSSSQVVLTITAGGYTLWAIPNGGATYTFTATNGANILAMTFPSAWRD